METGSGGIWLIIPGVSLMLHNAMEIIGRNHLPNVATTIDKLLKRRNNEDQHTFSGQKLYCSSHDRRGQGSPVTVTYNH